MTDPLQLPYDEKAEKTLLGILLYNPDYYLEIHDRISPEDFYTDRHKSIMRLFRDTYLKRGKVEYMDIMEGKNGTPIAYLHECAELGEIYRSSDWALRTVLETSAKRKMQVGVYEIEKGIGTRSQEETSNALIDLAIAARRTKGKVYSPEDSADMAFHELERRSELGTRVHGYRTGFSIVDNHTGGLQGQRLTVISGPTGHGKSTTAINWMVEICLKQRVKGLFITLEMREQDVLNRVLSIHSGQDLQWIERGQVNSDIIGALEAVKQGGLYVTDNVSRDIHDVALTIEKYAVVHGVKIWCLDYIGRLDRDKEKVREDRDERFARWVKLLWNVTQRHNLHGIIVSQVNVYEQIAESKKIEHEADHSFFFKYVKEQKKNVLECRKNRFGPAWYKYLIDFNRSNQRMKECGILHEADDD